jgi:hypothetical protein
VSAGEWTRGQRLADMKQTKVQRTGSEEGRFAGRTSVRQRLGRLVRLNEVVECQELWGTSQFMTDNDKVIGV